MPYPLQFRPNRLCSVYDELGKLKATDAPLQLFRQLISCTFNQREFAGAQIWSPGQVLQRISLELPLAVYPTLGLANLAMDNAWFLRMNEDPSLRSWFILDGIVWESANKNMVAATLAETTKDPAPVVLPVFIGSSAGCIYATAFPIGTDVELRLPTDALTQWWFKCPVDAGPWRVRMEKIGQWTGDACVVWDQQEELPCQAMHVLRGSGPIAAEEVLNVQPGFDSMVILLYKEFAGQQGVKVSVVKQI